MNFPNNCRRFWSSACRLSASSESRSCRRDSSTRFCWSSRFSFEVSTEKWIPPTGTSSSKTATILVSSTESAICRRPNCAQTSILLPHFLWNSERQIWVSVSTENRIWRLSSTRRRPLKCRYLVRRHLNPPKRPKNVFCLSAFETSSHLLLSRFWTLPFYRFARSLSFSRILTCPQKQLFLVSASFSTFVCRHLKQPTVTLTITKLNDINVFLKTFNRNFSCFSCRERTHFATFVTWLLHC